MTKVAMRIALLPRLKQQVVLRNNPHSSHQRHLSGSVKHKRLNSCSSNSSGNISSKQLNELGQYPQRRNLIGPMVLNPYRHRRHSSSGDRLNSDSTSKRKQQLPFSRVLPQNQHSNLNVINPWQSTEKQQSKGTCITFKRWLRKHIENQNQNKHQPQIQQKSRVLNKRQLIDKLSMRGQFRHRANHERLDFAIDQRQKYWDQVQESCIIRTEEENPHELCSMTSILKLMDS